MAKRKRRTFTKEFKAQAVRLVMESGKPVGTVAQDLVGAEATQVGPALGQLGSCLVGVIPERKRPAGNLTSPDVRATSRSPLRHWGVPPNLHRHSAPENVKEVFVVFDSTVALDDQNRDAAQRAHGLPDLGQPVNLSGPVRPPDGQALRDLPSSSRGRHGRRAIVRPRFGGCG
jgi:Transposase